MILPSLKVNQRPALSSATFIWAVNFFSAKVILFSLHATAPRCASSNGEAKYEADYEPEGVHPLMQSSPESIDFGERVLRIAVTVLANGGGHPAEPGDDGRPQQQVRRRMPVALCGNHGGNRRRAGELAEI